MVKPSPGTRALNTVSYQQIFEIEQMLFITNEHVLVQFRFGKIVIFNVNGKVVPQNKEVQKILNRRPTIVAQSHVKRGMTFVALEVREISKRDMISLEFHETGKAKVVGIFENYALKMNQGLKNQGSTNEIEEYESEDSEEKDEQFKE